MDNLYEKNKIFNINAIYIILDLIYFLVWIVIGFFLLFYLVFGDDLLTGFLGDNAKVILLGISVLGFLLPLFLKFLKKKWLKYIIKYISTGIFILSFFILIVTSKNYFSDFTKEKWLEYPKLRSYMLDDLTKNHGLIGSNRDEVIALLGLPDTENDTIFAYYLNKVNKDSMFIEVRFENGKVISAINHLLL